MLGNAAWKLLLLVAGAVAGSIFYSGWGAGWGAGWVTGWIVHMTTKCAAGSDGFTYIPAIIAHTPRGADHTWVDVPADATFDQAKWAKTDPVEGVTMYGRHVDAAKYFDHVDIFRVCCTGNTTRAFKG